MLFDNEEQPIIIARGSDNKETEIFELTKWQAIVKV